METIFSKIENVVTLYMGLLWVVACAMTLVNIARFTHYTNDKTAEEWIKDNPIKVMINGLSFVGAVVFTTIYLLL